MKISNSARISREFYKTTASPLDRLNYAKELNKQFFEKLVPEFKTDKIDADIYIKNLHEVSPPNIILQVEKNADKKQVGAVSLGTNKKSIAGYIMELPIDKNNQISIYDMDTCMHEPFHYFVEMNNPKHIARFVSYNKHGKKDEFEKFYWENLYSKRDKFDIKELKKNLDEFLNNLGSKQKLDFLQNSRYRLSEEKYAYEQGNIYLDKIQDIHSDIIPHKIDGHHYEEYHFEEKIKLLNDTLRDTINTIRENNKM